MKLSKSSNKPLVLSMALMVLLALVIPFAGTALATHPAERTEAVTMTPEADTAAVGTCNEFTVTATGQNGAPAEGETVTLTVAQSDADTTADLVAGFCDPDGAGPAVDAGGSDTDDDLGVESPARATGQCVTGPVDNDPNTAPAGTCTFGIDTNEPGQAAVRACVTEQDQFGGDQQICDTSTKTWVAGGPEAVETLDCEPEADSNPEATEHFITCTATGANGVGISGVQVQARVTAGPNEGTVLTCGQVTRNQQGTVTARTPGTTNNQGQAECWYTDDNDNDVGTDTIVAFIDQAAPAGGTARAGQPDAHEPQDTVTKTWFGPGRVVNCEPETATNAAGTQHTITCTVTDREGNPVTGQQVTFFEEGPGRFSPGGTTTGQGTSTTTATTNEQGVATVVTTTFENEQGIQEITGALPQTAGADECEAAANTPNQGDVAGVCADSVVKNWGQAPGPQPQCNDGVDNDNDGQIDFPNDPGCDSATDNDERDFPGQQFGGETGQPVTTGACAGFTTGSVQQNSTGTGLVIVGTNGPDALEGSQGDDLICALGADDAVVALGGNDTVYGGDGADTIEGGEGNDQLFGEGDKDEIDGAEGNDELFGGQSHDILQGGGGDDVLRGQNGWDTIKGEGGNDLLIGADGRDILQGGAGNDVANGGALDDVLKGYIGNDTLRGGGGDDIIKGFKGRDRLFGGGGNDFLHGGPGRDFCRGGRGRDIFRSCNP